MSDLCLVAAMMAKMQAADPSVALDPEPAALDRVSRQARHNAYKPLQRGAYSPAIAQASTFQPSFRPMSWQGAEFSTALASAQSPEPQSATPGATTGATPGATTGATQHDCYESSQSISRASSDKTLLAARSSSASEAMSKLTSPHYSPQYWSDQYRSHSKPTVSNGPRSGPQLYHQRLTALKAGRLYTRLPADSYRDQWSNVKTHPDYNQWKSLLALEARAVSQGQGNNRLSIVVGDSISQWLPMQDLPRSQLWMNQGISGDTTRGILQRLSAFKDTRPTSLYVMAGVNDLKNGASDGEVTANLQKIMQQLRRDHPQAEVFVQSILPTDTPNISNERIRQINGRLAAIARQEQVSFLNLHSQFTDLNGKLDTTLTTDGIHLNPEGYAVWQSILRNMEYWVALNRNLGYRTPWAS